MPSVLDPETMHIWALRLRPRVVNPDTIPEDGQEETAGRRDGRDCETAGENFDSCCRDPFFRLALS
jgi:hypothetical protein